MSEIAATPDRSSLDTFFRFGEHRTTLRRDTIAGVTTFIVMSYIIFVNPAILGFAGVPGLDGQGLPFDGVLTSTCLVAGVMTIIMGLYTNRAYAGQAAYFRKIEQWTNDDVGALEPLLPTLDVPVRLVWGEDDRWLDRSVAERLRSLVPDAELVLVPRAGHFAPEDAPADVARALEEFFAAV